MCPIFTSLSILSTLENFSRAEESDFSMIFNRVAMVSVMLGKMYCGKVDVEGQVAWLSRRRIV